MKMNERELAALIDEAERDGLTNSGTFMKDQETYLSYYQAQPFGDEVEGRSQVISTDVRDLIESDMPSLARVFLGAGDPVEFKPLTPTTEAVKEAKDKQALVSHILKSVPDSFRIQHDWLKSSEMQDLAAIEYGVEEVKTARYKSYRNLSDDELAGLISDIENDKHVESVDIDETDEESNSVKLKIIHKRNSYFIRNVAIEDLIISKNTQTKNDATVVGKRFIKTRSELLAEGFSREIVDSLPEYKTAGSEGESNSLKSQRYQQQGGEKVSNINAWANQYVRGEDVYINIDFDGDGITERRHVIKCGNIILENEPHDHVPYAIASSMLMPNNIVGISRAQLAKQYQRINSVLWRQMLDNTYAVNNPRHVYTDDIDLDDLLDIQLNGVVHSEGIPQQSIMPLETPYVSDKTLQVVQYIEGKKGQATGSIQQNQALEADQLHKETATRFRGLEDAATAKIELVARVIAETGYRDLWEGIAWYAAHYQDEQLELKVLGRQMTFNPADWRYDHTVVAKVGTGAGDDEKTMQNLGALYQMQQGLLQQGSPLVDNMKIYNTLSEMVKTVGREAVNEYFNNPEMPEQMVMAERDMLKQMVQQMEQQLMASNPLAEAEQVKGQMQMQMEQLKQKFTAQIETLKMQQASEQKIQDIQSKYATDMQELKFKYDQLMTNSKYDYTALAAAEGNSLAEIQAIQAGLSTKSDQELLAMLG